MSQINLRYHTRIFLGAFLLCAMSCTEKPVPPKYFWVHCEGLEYPGVCVAEPAYCMVEPWTQLCGWHYYGDKSKSPPSGWHIQQGGACDFHGADKDKRLIVPCDPNPNPPPLPSTQPPVDDNPVPTGGPEDDPGPDWWYCKWDAKSTELSQQTGTSSMCFYHMKTEDMSKPIKRAQALADPVFHRKCWHAQGDLVPCAAGSKDQAIATCGELCATQRALAESGLFADESVIPNLPGETHDTWTCKPAQTEFGSTITLVDPNFFWCQQGKTEDPEIAPVLAPPPPPELR